MYYLPFSPKTRFAALPDTVENRASLDEFMVSARTWEEFLAKYGASLVAGTPQLGIFLSQGNTFVTNDVGFPQVLFDGAPPTLLFVYGHYAGVGSGNSFSYGELAPGYVRWAIDYAFLQGSPAALESILARLTALENGRVANAEFESLEHRVVTNETSIRRLNQRQDPLEAVLPLISAERQVRFAKDADLQSQINSLQVPVSERTLELTNYYDKGDIDQLLADRATEGYVDTRFNTSALQVDLEALEGRTEDAEARLDDLSSLEILYDGITVINQGTFMLSRTPGDLVLVFLNGTLRAPDTYTVSGDIVTFDSIRPAGDRVIIVSD